MVVVGAKAEVNLAVEPLPEEPVLQAEGLVQQGIDLCKEGVFARALAPVAPALQLEVRRFDQASALRAARKRNMLSFERLFLGVLTRGVVGLALRRSRPRPCRSLSLQWIVMLLP